MILLLILICLVTAPILKCEVSSPLKCKVVWGSIYLELPMSVLHNLKRTKASYLYFISTDIETNKTEKFSSCRYINELVRCTAWDVKNAIKSKSKFSIKLFNKKKRYK